MLDADDVLEPEFVSQALPPSGRRTELAYSDLLAGVGRPRQIGANRGWLTRSATQFSMKTPANWDGDTIAVIPRRLFSNLAMASTPTP